MVQKIFQFTIVIIVLFQAAVLKFNMNIKYFQLMAFQVFLCRLNALFSVLMLLKVSSNIFLL